MSEQTTEASDEAQRSDDPPPSVPAKSERAPESAVPSRSGKKKKKKKSADDGPPAVIFKSVSKHFGNIVAVHDVSFEIPDGAVYGLIGPNGAGKTTSFSMLAGYLSPTHGQIIALDRSPDDVHGLKGKIGVLPQDALLPAGDTVGDFMTYIALLQGIAPNDVSREVGRVLEEVEGTAWWNYKCGQLSHGMAKRVGLAQAFLGSPQIILLDEPTAGLDPRVAYGVRQLVRSRKGKATMVISSHNLQELEEICDYAAILDRGRLVVADTMQELTASSSEVAFELAPGPIPEEQLRAIEGVKTAAFEPANRELTVTFDRRQADAEEMIRRCLVVLLQMNARISSVSKGRSLEQRVMELTE